MNTFRPGASLFCGAFVSSVVFGSVCMLNAATARGDTAADLHSALKERWYTTELIVFRNVDAPARESVALEGDRLTLAEERLQGTQPAIPAEEPALNDLTEQAEALSDPALTTVKVLTDGQRPELDALPWDDIKDYDAAPDLGELVARNMATWETQLRTRDGELLNASELQLTDTAAKLRRSRGVEVMFHGGWTQAVPARDAGKPIELSAGERVANTRDGAARSQLEGEVTVTLGRYLHVHPILYYTTEASLGPTDETEVQNQGPLSAVARARAAAEAAQGTGASGSKPEVRDLSSNASALDRLRERKANQRYSETAPRRAAVNEFELEQPPYIRLDQSRRVRSGELHYIDHPELGVIVRIIPVVAPAPLQEQFALLQ